MPCIPNHYQNDGQNGEIGPQAIKALMGMVDQRVQGNLLNMRRDGEC
ncbi:putative phage tail length tape measure protein [Escherichia coli]|uniref:Putative phage tail length tape measure protein n=1 Tax=Escherichia coli TaxID=562 RepID=A0A376RIX0_ECOLX|nr:putative phage tail length tape measure protein [Escherichia coli]